MNNSSRTVDYKPKKNSKRNCCFSCLVVFLLLSYINKDENVHKFALSAIRGELQEREREKEKKRARDNIKCDKKGGQKV